MVEQWTMAIMTHWTDQKQTYNNPLLVHHDKSLKYALWTNCNTTMHVFNEHDLVNSIKIVKTLLVLLTQTCLLPWHISLRLTVNHPSYFYKEWIFCSQVLAHIYIFNLCDYLSSSTGQSQHVIQYKNMLFYLQAK